MMVRAHTPCGPVVGTVENGTAAFRGIRYAAPVRFSPAQPLTECWKSGVLNATANPNRCWQYPPGDGKRQSEDCLFLNIFAPHRHNHSHVTSASSPLLPVFFFIHGGSNVVGSLSSYGPIERIPPRLTAIGQPHVLVAAQYRLGALGFLTLPELASDDPRGVSGNYAITDLLAALRWVKEGVRWFGGDPERVTIIGQSSGATNVYALMASRPARGLFHAAIALSGSPNLTMTRDAKEAQDATYYVPNSPCANATGASLLACLRAAPAKALVEALPSSYAVFDTLYDYPVDRVGMGGSMRALPHVDGVTVSAPLLEALRSRVGSDVPFLLQSMASELDCYPNASLINASAAAASAFVSSKLAPAFGTAMAASAAARYLRVASDLGFPPEMAVYALDADTASGCGLKALAKAASSAFRSPVYLGTGTAPVGDPQPGRPKFPFHNWDFECASHTYDFYGDRSSVANEDFGFSLLRTWANLSMYGKLSDSSAWRAVREAPGWPAHYYSTLVSAAPKPVVDLKSELCDFWENHGVAQNWWWIN